jgi:GH35 family endo-1,4-beta-xylanase
VWPSWKHSPKGLDSLKNDTAALRKAILDRVNFIIATFKGKIPQWDIINEITYHHNIVDIIGKPEMIKWYKAAHEADAAATLFINDFTMFHQKENNADGVGSDYIYNTIKYLLDNGAPLHAIAEQAHIGGTPPGIPHVLSRLDQFSKFKLPIAISEFDIYSDDDDFKAKYLGDFMTAIYSHPNTTGFTQWGFWAGEHWIPMAALWNKDWTLRKHGKVYTDLVTKTWWTNYEGKTAGDGSCKLRGFCGDYEITVTHNGKSVQQKYSLNNKGGKLIVKL